MNNINNNNAVSLKKGALRHEERQEMEQDFLAGMTREQLQAKYQRSMTLIDRVLNALALGAPTKKATEFIASTIQIPGQGTWSVKIPRIDASQRASVLEQLNKLMTFHEVRTQMPVTEFVAETPAPEPAPEPELVASATSQAPAKASKKKGSK